MRAKVPIHVLSGHTGTVGDGDVKCQASDPQVITGSVNSEGVFFSSGDNGSMSFWDCATGTLFQNMEDFPQPGLLEAEAGIFCSTFDVTDWHTVDQGWRRQNDKEIIIIIGSYTEQASSSGFRLVSYLGPCPTLSSGFLYA